LQKKSKKSFTFQKNLAKPLVSKQNLLYNYILKENFILERRKKRLAAF